MNITDYDLIIFDADGTIISREDGEYLFDVPGLFERIHNKGIHTSICSNQGGPASYDAWGGKYPPLQYTLDRYERIGEDLRTQVYLSLAFRSPRLGWFFPDDIHEDDERVKRSWRKPAPGMLKAAMRYYNVHPKRALMVGDDEKGADSGAAQNAGVAFMHIEEFKREMGIE